MDDYHAIQLKIKKDDCFDEANVASESEGPFGTGMSRVSKFQA